jgi:hypothetical protein
VGRSRMTLTESQHGALGRSRVFGSSQERIDDVARVECAGARVLKQKPFTKESVGYPLTTLVSQSSRCRLLGRSRPLRPWARQQSIARICFVRRVGSGIAVVLGCANETQVTIAYGIGGEL